MTTGYLARQFFEEEKSFSCRTTISSVFREYTFDGQLQSLPTLFSMLNINDQRLFYAAHQRLFYAEHGLGASSMAQQLKYRNMAFIL